MCLWLFESVWIGKEMVEFVCVWGGRSRGQCGGVPTEKEKKRKEEKGHKSIDVCFFMDILDKHLSVFGFSYLKCSALS